MTIEELSFNKALTIYEKLFSLGYLNTNVENKLVCISLTCYITYQLKKKGKEVTCYDVLLKVGSDFRQSEKDGFLKSLGVVCESIMYGCEEFPTFGIEPKDIPKTLKTILATYCPF